MTPPNLGDEQPHSGGAPARGAASCNPCGSSARSPATRRRPFAVDPAFQRTAASTDRSAWHPPEPIARPQSATSSDAQAEQVRFRFRMGAPTGVAVATDPLHPLVVVRVAVHQASPDGFSGTGWTRPLTLGAPTGLRGPWGTES